MANNRQDLNEVFEFLGLDISKKNTNDLYVMQIHLNEYINCVKHLSMLKIPKTCIFCKKEILFVEHIGLEIDGIFRCIKCKRK